MKKKLFFVFIFFLGLVLLLKEPPLNANIGVYKKTENIDYMFLDSINKSQIDLLNKKLMKKDKVFIINKYFLNHEN
jgi:hypothetical protein